MRPIFITESKEQSHLPAFDVEVIAFTFIPNVQLKKDSFVYPKLPNMQEICKSDRVIILAHDLDEQGELMSSLLYYSFLLEGVDEERLIRMPLTSNGIGYIGEFFSEDKMNRLKDYYVLERLFLNKHKICGLKRAMALKHLYELSFSKDNHRVLNKNMNGTNTVTHIVKQLIGEN